MPYCALLKDHLTDYGQRLHDLDIPAGLRWFAAERDAIEMINDFCANPNRFLIVFHEKVCEIVLKPMAEFQRLPDFKTLLKNMLIDIYDASFALRCVLIKEGADRTALLLEVGVYMRKLADFLADFCWTKAPLRSLGSFGGALKFHALLRLWLLIIDIVSIFGAYGSDEEIEKVCQVDHRSPFHPLSGLPVAFLAQLSDGNGTSAFPCDCVREFWIRLADLNGELFLDDLLIDSVDTFAGSICFPQSLDLPMVQTFLDARPEAVGQMLVSVLCNVVPELIFRRPDPMFPIEQRSFCHILAAVRDKTRAVDDPEGQRAFLGWALFSFHRMLVEYQSAELLAGSDQVLQIFFNDLHQELSKDPMRMEVDPLPSSFLNFPTFFSRLTDVYQEIPEFLRFRWHIMVKICIILLKNGFVWSDSQSFLFSKFTPLVLTRKVDDPSASRLFSLWLSLSKCIDFDFVAQFVEKSDQMVEHGSAHKQSLYLNALLYLFSIQKDKEVGKRLFKKALHLLHQNASTRPSHRAVLVDLVAFAAEQPDDWFTKDVFQTADQSARHFTDSDIDQIVEKLRNAPKVPGFLVLEVRKRWVPGLNGRRALEFLINEASNNPSPAARPRRLEQLLTDSINGIRIYPLDHVAPIVKSLLRGIKLTAVVDSIPRANLIRAWILCVTCGFEEDPSLNSLVVDYLNESWSKSNLKQIETPTSTDLETLEALCTNLHDNYATKPDFVMKRVDEFFGSSTIQMICKFQKQAKSPEVTDRVLNVISVLLSQLGSVLAKPLAEKRVALSTTAAYNVVDFLIELLKTLPASHEPPLLQNLVRSYVESPDLVRRLPDRLTCSLVAVAERLLGPDQTRVLADTIGPALNHLLPSLQRTISRNLCEYLRQQ